MSTIEDHNCYKRVRNFCERLGIGPGTRILIALSGGPDSTALLAVFGELRKHLCIDIGCAYVNHGLREARECRQEEEHIRRCADRFQVRVHRRVFPPGFIEEYARREGCGIEAAGRSLRYTFFREIKNTEGYDYIALGHTENDQEETVITRFFQGAGHEGLTGIPETGQGLIRPFLTITKETILDFLNTEDIPYIRDSTNEKSDYQRNAVRNLLIPKIEEVFPGFRKGIASFREKMEEAAAYIDAESLKQIPWTYSPGRNQKKLQTPFSNFVSAPPVLRKHSLYTSMNTLGCSAGRRIPARFISDTDRRIGEKIDNGGISEGYGCHFSRYGDLLFAAADVVFPEKKGYLVVVDSSETEIITQSGFQIQKTLLSSNVEKAVWLFDYIEMYPLLFRSWRSGDAIAGKNGSKNIRKMFQEWDVPDDVKWEIPIVEDRAGIRAVFGSLFGFSDRYRIPDRIDSWQRTDKIIVFSFSKDGKNL